MSKDYSRFYLSENPFPQSATIEITSPDKRINGSIFCESVLQDQVIELETKLNKRINLIYLLGFEWEKGTGKSALVVNAWKKHSNIPDVASIYLKCSNVPPYNEPSGFCIGIVKQLHKNNLLWDSLKKLLSLFVQETKPLFPKESAIETLFNAFPTMPNSLPLTRYTYVTNTEKFASEVSTWLSNKTKLDASVCQKWLFAYLTAPNSFDITLDRMGKGISFDCYKFFIKLLSSLGTRYFYIFLDQFEDAFMKIPTPKVGEFCLGMRRIIENSFGLSTIVATLHPDGETKLTGMGSEQLTQIAPLDSNHIVSVMTLRKKEDLSVPLGIAYLTEYRTSTPPYPTFPFPQRSLEFLCKLEGGNIRLLLQRLHYCLDYGLDSGAVEITPQIICENPREAIGREFKPNEDQFTAKYRNEQMEKPPQKPLTTKPAEQIRNKESIRGNAVEQLLLGEEGQKLEFKASLRYDMKAAEYGQEKANPELEKEVLREIDAFMNAEGGVLLIGIEDETKKVIGLANDYKFLKKPNKDGFEVFLRDKLAQNLEPDIPGLVKISFDTKNGSDVCIVQVEKASEPMFLKDFAAGKEIREFWIREGNHKRPLVGAAMMNYIQQHWK